MRKHVQEWLGHANISTTRLDDRHHALQSDVSGEFARDCCSCRAFPAAIAEVWGR